MTAFSHKGVGHFGRSIEVESDINGPIDALLLENGLAVVAWRNQAGSTKKLQLARIFQDGTVYGPIAVYRGAFARWPGPSYQSGASG